VAALKLTDAPVLWVGFLAGPVAWAVQELAVFGLSAWACEGGPAAVLHVVSALCLAGALGGGYLAWRGWRTVGGWPTGADEPEPGRARFMTTLGVLSSALFSWLIVAQWLAAVLLPLCPTAGGE
jgi:hypothetical protein